VNGRCRNARPGRLDTCGFLDVPEGSIMTTVVPKRLTWLAAKGIVLRYLLLLAAFYAYVLLVVDTRLIHDRYISVSMRFSRTWDHLLARLDQTGALVAYAAGWLHQYYCHGPLGAAILTLVAAALAAGLDLWMPVRRNSWLRLLSFLPAVGLLVAANYYDLKLPHPGGPLLYALGLLLALLAANVHAHLPSRRLHIRIASGLILAVIVYHAGGAIYSVARGAGEATGRIYLPGPLPIFVGLAVVRELWTRWLAAAARQAARSKTQATTRSPAAAVAVWLVQLAILAGAGAAVAQATRQPDLRMSFQLDFCRHHGLWGEFLEVAARITPDQFAHVARSRPSDAFCLNHDINRALYHQGRLLDDMFAYPQAPGGLLLVDRTDRTKEFIRPEVERYAAAFFELGRVNAAEHAAHELLQVDGDRPATLRLLAEVNIVKDQRPAAQTFLGYLRQLRTSPCHECWAGDLLEHYRLHGEFPLDERLRRIRQWNLRDDYILRYSSVFDDMQRLLESNPNNRMAFEYLVADCLLNRRWDDLPDQLDRFKALGYARLPRHVQEGLMLYTAGPNARVSRDRFVCDAAVRRTYERFGRTVMIVRQRGGARPQTLRALAADPELVRTYFWYVYSTFVPVEGPAR